MQTKESRRGASGSSRAWRGHVPSAAGRSLDRSRRMLEARPRGSRSRRPARPSMRHGLAGLVRSRRTVRWKPAPVVVAPVDVAEEVRGGLAARAPRPPRFSTSLPGLGRCRYDGTPGGRAGTGGRGASEPAAGSYSRAQPGGRPVWRNSSVEVGEGLAGLLQLLGLDLLLDPHLHRDALVELGADDLAPGVGFRDRELLAGVREADAPLGLEELALLALLFEGVGGLRDLRGCRPESPGRVPGPRRPGRSPGSGPRPGPRAPAGPGR